MFLVSDYSFSSVKIYGLGDCSFVDNHPLRPPLVWFCKHLKYCGTNAELSLAIVGPEEDDSETEATGGASSGQPRKYLKRGDYYKNSTDRMRITGETSLCSKKS